MKKLSYSDSFLNQSPEIKDLANLSSHIMEMFSNVRAIHVNRMRITPDEKHDTMVTVEIDFQTWVEGENGNGSSWTWKCYRAKNHSCSNSGIEESAPSKLARLYKDGQDSVLDNVAKLDKVQMRIFIDLVK